MLLAPCHFPKQYAITFIKKNSTSFPSHHLSLSVNDPSHFTEKTNTYLVYMSAFLLKCLYLYMRCFVLMIHIFSDFPVILLGLSSLSCVFSLFFTGSFPFTFFSDSHVYYLENKLFNFFIVFSFSFFLSPLWEFSKLNLHSIASNSLSTNFLPTIWSVCNLITPTTALLKTCSFKSHQCPLHCQCQRPLFFYLSSSLPFTSTFLKFLAFLSAYTLLLFLVLDTT